MHQKNRLQQTHNTLVQTGEDHLVKCTGTQAEALVTTGNTTLEQKVSGRMETDIATTRGSCSRQSEVSVDAEESDRSEFMTVTHGEFNDFSRLLCSTKTVTSCTGGK